MTTGSNGSRIITLREKYLNDQLVSSREEAEYVTQAPVNATALLGQPGAAISPYEPFPGVVTDEKGAPVNYTAVYAQPADQRLLRRVLYRFRPAWLRWVMWGWIHRRFHMEPGCILLQRTGPLFTVIVSLRIPAAVFCIRI